MKKLKPANNINRSLNESEHNILELIQQQNKDSLAVYLSYVLTKNHSTKKSFRYYNQALAEKVYNQYRTVIQKANALLPADEKIPTQPHQPKGYTTRWNKKYIDIEDIKIILDSFDKNEKFEKSPYKIQCPPNFDLLAYYAKHFDIFIKNIDPYEHYAKSIKKAVLPK